MTTPPWKSILIQKCDHQKLFLDYVCLSTIFCLICCFELSQKLLQLQKTPKTKNEIICHSSKFLLRIENVKNIHYIKIYFTLPLVPIRSTVPTYFRLSK